MDSDQRLSQWATKMGYHEKIPSTFRNICNPSTLFIWEQIITNVKPRQEVDSVRKNILIQKFQPEFLLQDEARNNCPIKEVAVYAEKLKLQKKVKLLENEIMEKDVKIEKLLTDNKMKYIIVNNLKQGIKESREKTYLLNRKSEMLKKDIASVEEMHTLAKNLSPVEMDENSSNKNITEMLEKCASKLEKILAEQNSTTNNSNNQSALNRSFFSTTNSKFKTPFTVSKNCFDKYLNLDNNDAKSSLPWKSSADVHSKKQLFKENKTPEAAVLTSRFSTKNQKKSSIKKSDKKRESLGLLSNSLLYPDDDRNSTAADDSFIFMLNDKNDRNMTAGTNHRNNDTHCSKQLFEDHARINGGSLAVKNDSMTFGACNDNVSLTGCQNNCLFSDRNLCEDLKMFLYRVNRNAIMNGFKSIYSDLLGDLQNVVSSSSHFEKNQRALHWEDLSELYLLHIRNELLVNKQKNSIKKLKNSLKKRKDDICNQLANNRSFSLVKPEDIRNCLDLQIEEVQTDVVTRFLLKEINASKQIPSTNELQAISSKIKRTSDEIDLKTNLIDSRMQTIFSNFQELRRLKNEVTVCIRNPIDLIVDMSWTEPLKSRLCSKEIEVFDRFPVEFNRKLNADGKKIAFRDLCNNLIPTNIVLDKNNLHILSSIMEAPFKPVESMVLDVLQSKIKLRALKVMDQSPTMPECKQFSEEELHDRENYIQDVLDKLYTILDSSKAREILASPALMQNTMDLWLDMPFTKAILDTRQVNGHPLNFYEKKFDSLHEKHNK